MIDLYFWPTPNGLKLKLFMEEAGLQYRPILVDIGKGVFVVLYLPRAHLPGIPPDPLLSREWLTLACGLAVILGHVYPVWFAFRGGKGVATMIGVAGALEPRLLLPVIGLWIVVLVLTGYVGLASMVAGAALAASVYLLDPSDGPLLMFCIVVELLVVFAHRGNIARMAAGTENRVRKIWLFRSRTA